VFIVLGAIQIVATALIMLYAARYKDRSCPIHSSRRPTAQTAMVAGTSTHSHAVTEFEATQFEAAHMRGTR
jgi:hypothetical protein